jgi:hypothetical protein
MVSNRTSLYAYTQHLNFISVLRQRILNVSMQCQSLTYAIKLPGRAHHLLLTKVAPGKLHTQAPSTQEDLRGQLGGQGSAGAGLSQLTNADISATTKSKYLMEQRYCRFETHTHPTNFPPSSPYLQINPSRIPGREKKSSQIPGQKGRKRRFCLNFRDNQGVLYQKTGQRNQTAAPALTDQF